MLVLQYGSRNCNFSLFLKIRSRSLDEKEAQWKAEQEESKRIHGELQATSKAHQELIVQLQRELEEEKSETKQQNQDLINLISKLERERKERSVLETEKEALLKSFEVQTEKAEKLEMEINKQTSEYQLSIGLFQEQIAELSDTKHKSDQRIEGLQHQIEESESHAARLQGEMEKLRDEAAAVTLIRNQLTNEVHLLKENYQSLQAALEDALK